MKMHLVYSTVRNRVIIAIGLLVLYPALPLLAAETGISEQSEDIPVVSASDVVIPATRTSTTLGSLNQSVTIVTEAQIQ
ncbi:MAG: hypothetical protein ABI604_14415 [Nitrospirota bacterium]